MQQQSLFKSAVRTLTLFTHGRALLAPAAFSWIAFMAFLTGSMALIEGVSWGRILSVFLPASMVWAAAAIGLIWGLAIYFVDASFVTLDTSGRAGKAANDNDKPRAPATGFLALARNKLFMGAFGRVVIVSISMALTGPFLAQTFDERKVVQAIEAQNAQAIARHHAVVARQADQKIDSVNASLTNANRQLVAETVGQGPSGRRGCAATCKAIMAEIDQLKGDRDRAIADKGQRLAMLAKLTPQQLEKDEGVRLVHDNADTRAKIRKQMEADSGQTILGFPASHVLASSLFLLLALTLLILKIYQPRSVAIYYNEHLQEAYVLYAQGGFAELPVTILPAKDHHDGPSPMTAQRFEAWYYNKYLPASGARDRHDMLKDLDERRKTVETRREATEKRIVELQADKAALQAERQAAQTQANELEERIMKQDDIIKATRHAKLTNQREAIEDARNQLQGKVDAIEVRAVKNGQALEETGMAIQRVIMQQGIPVHNGRIALQVVNAEVQARLNDLEGQLEALRDEKHTIDEERLNLGNETARLAAELAKVNDALAVTGEPGPGDIIHLDPDLRQLVEQLWALRKERDDLRPRIEQLDQRIAQCQAWIEEMDDQKRQDIELIIKFMAETRKLEAGNDTDQNKRAA